MRVCFLVNSYERHKVHNYLYLANAARGDGHETRLAPADSLCVRGGSVWARCLEVDGPLVPGHAVSDALAWTSLSTFDAVWLVGFGDERTKEMKLQMLWMLGQRVRLINSIEALQYLHNKAHLNLWPHVFACPDTHVSADFEYLWNLFALSDHDWVVKPPAGSFGRDVFLLRREDSNARVLLQHVTGNGGGQYCLMQRYVPEIRNGEKRVVLAGGAVALQYQKDIVPASDHRTNVRQGGAVSPCTLTPDEESLCGRVGRFFMDRGVPFIGIDLAYPYVIEVNVVNPGGLISYEGLTGVNRASQVVAGVLRS